MKIAVVLNSHGNTEITADCIDAIKTYVSDDILMIVDGASWKDWGSEVDLPVKKLNGFIHKCPSAPYRNLTYGLSEAFDVWPDYDWYCYCEYDVLFTSPEFKDLLEDNDKYWCVGTDYHRRDFLFFYLNSILNEKIVEGYYLLGACVFYSGKFLKLLKEKNFFTRFLMKTNDFTHGFFPGYDGYDFGEALYPTLAKHYGKEIKSMSDNRWKYAMRWKPEVGIDEYHQETSIMHPVKNNPELREFQKSRRLKWKSMNIK